MSPFLAFRRYATSVGVASALRTGSPHHSCVANKISLNHLWYAAGCSMLMPLEIEPQANFGT
jgi:hypothetical protein